MDEEKEISEFAINEFRRCFRNNPIDIELYQLNGPSNPFKKRYEEDIQRNCESSEDGICYMMKCQCFEYDMDDIPTGDWYKGECLICKEKLPTKRDAWRFPCINGGFTGCYCKDHYRCAFNDINGTAYETLCDIMEAIRNKYPIKYNGGGPIILEQNIELENEYV